MRFASRLIVALVGIIAIVELLLLLFFYRQQSKSLLRKLTLEKVRDTKEYGPDLLNKRPSVLSPKVDESSLQR